MFVSQQKYPSLDILCYCFAFIFFSGLVAKSTAYFFKNGLRDATITEKNKKKRNTKSSRSSTALLADRAERETFDSFLRKKQTSKRQTKRKQRAWTVGSCDTERRGTRPGRCLLHRRFGPDLFVTAIDLSCSACGRLCEARTALLGAEGELPRRHRDEQTRLVKASGC